VAPAPQKRHATFAEKKEYEQLEKAMVTLEAEKQQITAKLNGGSGSPLGNTFFTINEAVAVVSS
jgi:ATP-binding cassette subfamily F protein uup